MKSITDAGSISAALKAAVTDKPTLVVMDVHLPDGDGIDATQRLLRAVPETTVLIYTMEVDVDGALVRRALDAGAKGFLLKDLDMEDFVCALRAVAGGSLVISPEAGRVMRAGSPEQPHLQQPLDRLTPRELEILKLMVRSTSTTGIAHALGVSQKTVRNQASAIYGKLEVRDRTEAALLAVRLGLVM